MQGLLDTARAGADALALRGDPAMSALLFAWLWLSGAVWASFCGVLAFRLPRVMGWADGPPTGLSDPPSSCDGCGARIPPLAIDSVRRLRRIAQGMAAADQREIRPLHLQHHRPP